MFYLGKCGARRIILGNRPISTVTRGPRHLQVARSTWQWKWLGNGLVVDWNRLGLSHLGRDNLATCRWRGPAWCRPHGKAEPAQSGRCRARGGRLGSREGCRGLKLLSKLDLPILPLQLRNRKGKLGNLCEKIWLEIWGRREADEVRNEKLRVCVEKVLGNWQKDSNTFCLFAQLISVSNLLNFFYANDDWLKC